MKFERGEDAIFKIPEESCLLKMLKTLKSGQANFFIFHYAHFLDADKT